MNAVFPLIQKYGGVVIGLTLDENGIPKTAKGRLEVAGKIIEEAKKYGIDKKDIVIDVLTMTISSEPNGAKTTLEALKMVRDTYGVRTALGVSNISFGLPSRPVINANLYYGNAKWIDGGDYQSVFRGYDALVSFLLCTDEL